MTDIISPHADRSLASVTSANSQRARVRVLCERHAAALLALAGVLLDDIDTAGDIVAATLAAACRDGQLVASTDHETRTRLARSVYHRCCGRLAFVERFPQLSHTSDRSGTTPSGFERLPMRQRAIVALATFGGHDMAQISRTLNLPMDEVAAELPQLLHSVGVRSAG